MVVPKQEGTVKYDRATVSHIASQLEDNPGNHVELFSALMQHLGTTNQDEPLVELIRRFKTKAEVPKKPKKKLQTIPSFQDQFMGMYD